MRITSLIGPLVLLGSWEIVALTGFISPLILPTPGDVAIAFWHMVFTDRSILLHIGFTGYRTVISFLLSCLLGIPIGLAMGFLPRVYRSLEVIVDFFRSVPPMAIFPLFLLILGIGEKSKLGVPVYGCTLVIIVNSVYGVFNVPSLRRTVGRIYGLSKWQIFWKIVLPDSLPQVFVGMRTALSLALVLTVMVEMFIGSENGLGKKVYDYHLLFETPEMYVGILLTGMIGYTLNKGFILLESCIVHWADK